MNWKYILAGIVVVAAFLIIGCSMMIDLYPAIITKDLAIYTNHDPNHLNWPVGSMGNLREWLTEASLKHQLNQADIEYAAKKDNLIYTTVSTMGATYLQTAQQEVASTFGQNGWLVPVLSLFLGGTIGGVGVGTIVAKVKDSTNYTPAETRTIANTAATTGKAPEVI